MEEKIQKQRLSFAKKMKQIFTRVPVVLYQEIQRYSGNKPYCNLLISSKDSFRQVEFREFDKFQWSELEEGILSLPWRILGLCADKRDSITYDWLRNLKV